MKDESDFFLNWPKDAIGKCNNGNFAKYQKYLNSISILYDKYQKEECSDYFDYYVNICEEYFKEEEIYNPKIIILALENYKDQDFDSKVKFEDLYENAKKLFIPEGSESVDGKSNITFKCSKGFYWNEKLKKFERDLMCSDTQEVDITRADAHISSSFSYYQIIFNSVFAFLGTFFIFLLLYKFIPLGSKINRKTREKENMNYNIYDNDTEYLWVRDSKFTN
ncbi:PIR Superfamily Protein [Plasmodium ovale curtisi]|uniref:PIR Superfamily Protein n=1 Tax=Plasmodium ovale curtisi TaxID=864141 RepID=A0A1A8WRX5_PLAOA|nr:PIR Superfamily Protein [Plasmodium ovale curtisi]